MEPCLLAKSSQRDTLFKKGGGIFTFIVIYLPMYMILHDRCIYVYNQSVVCVCGGGVDNA